MDTFDNTYPLVYASSDSVSEADGIIQDAIDLKNKGQNADAKSKLQSAIKILRDCHGADDLLMYAKKLLSELGG